MANLTHIREALDPAFNYLVFRREKMGRGKDHFSDALEYLDRLNIELLDREIYRDETMDHIYLKVKLKDKQIEEGTKELLASVMPKSVTCFIYSRKTGS